MYVCVCMPWIQKQEKMETRMNASRARLGVVDVLCKVFVRIISIVVGSCRNLSCSLFILRSFEDTTRALQSFLACLPPKPPFEARRASASNPLHCSAPSKIQHVHATGTGEPNVGRKCLGIHCPAPSISPIPAKESSSFFSLKGNGPK